MSSAGRPSKLFLGRCMYDEGGLTAGQRVLEDRRWYSVSKKVL